MNTLNARPASINFPLTGLAQTTSAVNYTVSFHTLAFTTQENEPITITTLQELYPGMPVSGTIEPITFGQAQQLVNRCLAYHVKGSFPQITHDTELTMARFLTFWHLIKEEISLPCTQVYIHKPDYNSYFAFGVVWNFCFILVDQTKGLVISGQAHD